MEDNKDVKNNTTENFVKTDDIEKTKDNEKEITVDNIKNTKEKNNVEPNKNKEGKKKSGVKKYIIFVIIFAIIATSITAYLIYSTNNKNENLNNSNSTKKNAKAVVKDTVEPALIGSKYDENDLIFEKVEETIVVDEIITECYYILIKSGLKNEEVKDKINEEVKKYINSKDAIYVSEPANFSTVYLSANFSNVISYTDGNLNFNLINGERLKFEDLFLESANIKTILTQAIYDEYIAKADFEGIQYEDEISNFENADMSEIEEEILECITDYESKKETQNIKFHFNNRYIYIYLADKEIMIDMSKFADKIAIYNRFLTTENLYESNKIGLKNIYAYTGLGIAYDVENWYKDYYIYNNEKYENIYVSVMLNKVYNNEEEKEQIDNMFFAMKKYVDEKINEYKENAKNKPVYLIFDGIVKYSPFLEEVIFNLKFQEIEMDKEIYENKMDKILAEAYIIDDWFMIGKSSFLFEHAYVGEYFRNIDGISVSPIELIEDEIMEYITEPTVKNDAIEENTIPQNEISNNITNEIKNDVTNEITNEITGEIENEIENEIIENEIMENEVVENEIIDNTLENESTDNEITV